MRTQTLLTSLLLTSNDPSASVVALAEMEIARGRWTRSRTAAEWAQWEARARSYLDDAPAEASQEHVRAARFLQVLHGAEEGEQRGQVVVQGAAGAGEVDPELVPEEADFT